MTTRFRAFDPNDAVRRLLARDGYAHVHAFGSHQFDDGGYKLRTSMVFCFKDCMSTHEPKAILIETSGPKRYELHYAEALAIGGGEILPGLVRQDGAAG